MLHNVKLKQSSNHGKVSKTLQCLTCRFLFHLSLPANLLSVCRSQFKQWSFSNCFTHPAFITRTVQRDACQSACVHASTSTFSHIRSSLCEGLTPRTFSFSSFKAIPSLPKCTQEPSGRLGAKLS